MKRKILHGIWDAARNAFWLHAENRHRLGFKQSNDAQKHVDSLATQGFRNLRVRRMEASNEEWELAIR